MNLRAKQRGVALLTAIILVSLATVLAVSIAFGTAMTARRAASSFTVEQGVLFGGLAEEFAAFTLKRAAGNGTRPVIDRPGSDWTSPYPPTEVSEGIVIEAQLEDESGKFNLNSLLGGKDQNGQPVDVNSMEIFTRLLEALQLEPKWGPLIADFIDQDGNAQSNGGEDNLYTLQKPAYRAANGWITSPSELLSLPGFGRERYLKLLPFVTALPPDERKINVCFAGPQLIDAIAGVYTQTTYNEFTQAQATNAQTFAQQRGAGCFPDKMFFRSLGGSALDPTRKGLLEPRIVEQTEYFRLRTWVTIGTTRFALYSLL
ncbi:MAG: type II secretion system minor pseudopilin GspK, partial [Steroidobacteraceae bacterium]